ncbi:DEAD (Asp-Glu-Ala-Asp) box polypeptide 52 [Cichlidogyrus casuarinus]|uniref:RNA helicase n=1 Tax=Cichlidogyrus casuarinus TaxID=1844966 RepID=A0ABD2QJ64_9PLAT
MVEANIFEQIRDKKKEQFHARHQPFRDQVDPIFSALYRAGKSLKECCIALFSATVSQQVNDWLKSLAKDGDQIEIVQINIGSKDSTVSTVDQWFKYCATEEGKLLEIQNMLIDGLLFPCLIFMESRARAKDVHQEIVISDRNLSAEVVSGDISEIKRNAIIKKFCQGEINVLICTDLLCRGIDFKNVKMVINYDAPVTKEDYIHRVGRTGRAGGVRGSAVTFWTDADIAHMSPLITVLRSSVNPARAKEYEELQELVDTWVKRRANKIQSKLSSRAKKFSEKGNFVVSARRRERKIANKIRMAVNQGQLPQKYFSPNFKLLF